MLDRLPDLMDLDTRRRIVALVRDYPGLHVREIARQLGEAQALVDYHVPKLVEGGLVALHREGKFVRIFPSAKGGSRPSDPRDRDTLALLRDRHALHIVLLLLDNEVLRHRDIMERTKDIRSLVTYHLAKLQKAGIIEKRDDGFALADAKGVSSLLAHHHPTRDLVDEFADLWASLYD